MGDFGYLSIGVGYTIPFQMFAAEWIDAEQFADSLNALKLPGVIFRPIHVKPFYSVGQGKQLHGVQVHLTKYPDAPLTDIQFYVMQEIARLYPDRAVLANADTARFRMMDQVTGSDYVRKTLRRATVSRISGPIGTRMSLRSGRCRGNTICTGSERTTISGETCRVIKETGR